MQLESIAVRNLVLAGLMLVMAGVAPSAHAQATADAPQSARLAAIIDGDHRSEQHKARDIYRHPLETLSFFGLREDMTVVEISPGGAGWYTEILAPFLKPRGTFYAGSYNPESESEYYRRNAKRFSDKLAAAPDLYGDVIVTVFEPPGELDMAPPGSADLVLTFRNMHNWIRRGYAEAVAQAMYRALKPGGVLGLVQHRGDPDREQDPASGYVRQAQVVELMESAGFRLAASSEINANPADDKSHPEGVWTLPPVLRLKEVDREKYLKIGESDRMTLKFVKPE